MGLLLIGHSCNRLGLQREVWSIFSGMPGIGGRCRVGVKSWVGGVGRARPDLSLPPYSYPKGFERFFYPSSFSDHLTLGTSLDVAN